MKLFIQARAPKLLKGSVDYDKWIDTSFLDAAYKEVDAKLSN